MDFRFTPEEEAFRREVRAFLDAELPMDWEEQFGTESESDAAWKFSKSFCKKMAARGWVGIAWPREYGGQGRSHMEQLIFNEELSHRRAPIRPIYMSTDRVGPSIIIYGTEEQKKRFLPRMTAAHCVFCQGFSEPGSGSDLASLQTRAVAEGDFFVVTGQKIYTSFAHRADYCILGTRTDPNAPKHRGITYFLMDMRLPGITVRLMDDMLGAPSFAELFLEDVRVSRRDMLGEENRGWYQMATTLDFERSGIGRVMDYYRTFEEVVQFAREQWAGRELSPPEAVLRNRLAEMALEFEIGRLLAYRVAWMQARGLVPNYEASMSKLFGDELAQRSTNADMQVLGLYGQLLHGSKWTRLRGRVERSYLHAVSRTVAAGTSEIQRNIMATRGLGLPR